MRHGIREESASGFYHITARGIGRQIIFEDAADRKEYLERLERCRDEEGIRLFAWCLMDNHVHLLVQGEKEALSKMMKRLNGAYATCFNKRHDRTGHLFQDRFFSAPIKDDRHFISTVRYIHRNPDHLTREGFKTWPWSSYHLYLKNSSNPAVVIDREFTLTLFGGMDSFLRMHDSPKGLPLYDPDEAIGSLNDDTLLKVARQILNSRNPHEIKSLPKDLRNKELHSLYEAGFTVRDIERVTSIGKSTIARVIKGKWDK